MTSLAKYPNPIRKSAAILGTLLLSLAASSLARAQATPAPKPPADVVVFTNGDRLTGTLEHGAGNSIVFKSDMAGEITIPLDKVKELHAAGSFAVLRKDRPIKKIAQARAIAPAPIAYADSKLTVGYPSAPEVVPTAQIANIIDAATYTKETTGKSGFFAGWAGALNGGATIVRSTDYGETLTAGIAMVRAMPMVSFLPSRDKTSFDLQETYGKLTSPVVPQTTPPTPAAVTETSIFHADAERDEYFSARLLRPRPDRLRPQLLAGPQPPADLRWRHRLLSAQGPQTGTRPQGHHPVREAVLPDRQQQRQPGRFHHLRDLPPRPAEETRALRVRQLHPRLQ